jgi:hypothetical protein
MKHISFLALVPLLLVGCVGVTVNRPQPQTTVVVPATTADSATIEEINGASSLGFEDSRTEALLAIAQRPTLSPTVQVHLVSVVYRRLTFEESKVRVLKAVIANPAFCDATKQSIVTQMNRFAFEDSKRQVLAALNEQATASTAAGHTAH